MLNPMIKIFCPFTQPASKLAKIVTAGAISSTVPICFVGCMFAMAVVSCSGFPSLHNVVSTGPNVHHAYE